MPWLSNSPGVLSWMAWLFSALLPHDDDDDNNEAEEYFAVLGLRTSAGSKKIRKAYKKKSLQHHPDKVAQRRRQNRANGEDEETLEDFRVIVQAYGVLQNPTKRRLYKALGCSPSKYQFLYGSNPQWGDPSSLYNNLAQSSFSDRSKLLSVVICFLGMIVLQPILIAIQVNSLLDKDDGEEQPEAWTDWMLLLLPTWIFHYLTISLFILLTLKSMKKLGSSDASAAGNETSNGGADNDEYDEDYSPETPIQGSAILLSLLTVTRWCAWCCGEVFLALQWDNYINWSYRQILIPFYIHFGLLVLSSCIEMQTIKKQVDRMVTLEHFEAHIIKKKYQDGTPAEKKEWARQYIIVHVPPDSAESSDPEHLTPEAENERMEQSMEYQSSMEVYSNALSSVGTMLVFVLPFIILLTKQLEQGVVDGSSGSDRFENVEWSWWLVFLPLWVWLGFKFFLNGYTICCLRGGGELEIDHRYEEMDEQENNGDSDNEEEPVASPTPVLSPPDPRRTVRGSGNTSYGDMFDTPEGTIRAAPLKPFTEVIGVKEQNTAEDVVIGDGRVKDEEGKDEEAQTEGGDDDAKDDFAPVEGDIIEKTIKESEQEKSMKLSDVLEEYIDEEDLEDFLREWQEANQEAESYMMEARAKAQASCCVVIFQAVVLGLVVGKLEQVEFSSIADDSSYDSFWVLFPLLVLAGLIFCCCCCFIYGAVELNYDEAKDDGDNENTNEGDAADGNKNGEVVHLRYDQEAVNTAANETIITGQDQPSGVEDEKNSDRRVLGTVGSIDDLD